MNNNSEIREECCSAAQSAVQGSTNSSDSDAGGGFSGDGAARKCEASESEATGGGSSDFSATRECSGEAGAITESAVDAVSSAIDRARQGARKYEASGSEATGGGREVRLFRISKASPEYPALRELWHQVFGDSPAYVDAFWDNWGSDIFGCVMCEGRAVVSALTCFRLGTLRGRAVVATYAVCTAPPARGKGYGSLITEYARDLVTATGAISVLSPAEPSLVEFYKPLGYEPNFTAGKLRNPPKDAPPADSTHFFPITASEYWNLREQILSDIPHIVPSDRTKAWVEADYGTFLAKLGSNGQISEICIPDAELLPVCAQSSDYIQGMSAGLTQPCENAYLGFAFD